MAHAFLHKYLPDRLCTKSSIKLPWMSLNYVNVFSAYFHLDALQTSKILLLCLLQHFFDQIISINYRIKITLSELKYHNVFDLSNLMMFLFPGHLIL